MTLKEYTERFLTEYRNFGGSIAAGNYMIDMVLKDMSFDDGDPEVDARDAYSIAQEGTKDELIEYCRNDSDFQEELMICPITPKDVDEDSVWNYGTFIITKKMEE